MIGRTEDLARLTAFLERAFRHGGSLLLTGDAGVGKTALLDAAAGTPGVRALRAAGAQFEADISFAALNQLLLPLREEFDGLGSASRVALTVTLGLDPGPPSDRMIVSTAVLTLLRQAAEERPLLLIVDDLPWLDRASAGVLGFVARRLAGSRVALLAAARTGEESFFERGGIPEQEVRPLTDEDAAELLSRLSPELGPAARRRVLTAAAGNPLALHEGSALKEVFARRIAELPEPARWFLLLAALDTTGRLHGGDDLAPAERAALIRIDRAYGKVVFRHPLTRSAVVELSTSEERRRAHRILAEQLAGDEERSAWHLAEATIGPDERIAARLERMASRVLHRGDGVGAVAALLRAADLSPDPSARSRRIAEAAYLGADTNGTLAQGSALLEEARRADPAFAGSLPAAVTASVVLLNGDGDIVTAHRLLAGAIESRPDPLDPGDMALISAFRQLLQVCRWAMRDDLWAVYHAHLARLGDGVPADLWLQTRTLADPARTAVAALPRLDASLAVLDDETDLLSIERTTRACAYVERLGAGRDALLRVVAAGRAGGPVTTAINALAQLGTHEYFAGRWDDAVALADEGLALCEAHGYRLMAWPLRLAQALVAAGRGDDAAVRATADDMGRWAAPRLTRRVEVFARHARGLAALAGGDFGEAYGQLAAISPAGELPAHAAHALWVSFDLVEAAVRAGHSAAAAAHVSAMRAAGIGAISPRYALYTAAGAALAGDTPELFEAALAVEGADRWPFDVARIRLAYGERLRRSRATAAARDQLAAARATFERLGARPWLARAGSAPATALTAQEHEIATLAAAGLTNRQIADRLGLSRHTVSAHLYRAFPKLGITTRAALRDALGN